MVTSFYPPYNFGGDGIFVQSLAELLVRQGHDVSVVHCEDAFRLQGNVQDYDVSSSQANSGITVHRLKSRFGALSPLLSHQLGRPALKGPRLEELLSQDFDVINFHNVSLMGGPGVLKFGNAPVKLYTLHEHWLVCATHILWKFGKKACDGRQCLPCSVRAGIPPQWWRYTGATKAALKHIDCFISPSRFTGEQHRAIYGELPIKVLPHFGRLEPLESDPEVGDGFLYVGRVTASKGIEGLLRVFSRLPERQLTVVGTGDLLDSVQQQYKDCANIRFLPFMDKSELRNIYSAARALILPSIAPETFGLTVIEAMACGTPSIVRDSGGCAEIVRDTGVGIVYATDDELIAAVELLATHDNEARRTADQTVEAFRKHYLPEHYVERYLQLIQQFQ